MAVESIAARQGLGPDASLGRLRGLMLLTSTIPKCFRAGMAAKVAPRSAGVSGSVIARKWRECKVVSEASAGHSSRTAAASMHLKSSRRLLRPE